jgi:hypothetical protein
MHSFDSNDFFNSGSFEVQQHILNGEITYNAPTEKQPLKLEKQIEFPFQCPSLLRVGFEFNTLS